MTSPDMYHMTPGGHFDGSDSARRDLASLIELLVHASADTYNGNFVYTYRMNVSRVGYDYRTQIIYLLRRRCWTQMKMLGVYVRQISSSQIEAAPRDARFRNGVNFE